MSALTEPSVQRIATPGATLYVECRGSGPMLLLIPGGNGDCVAFERLARVLADRYRVVGYDRRGFSRSVQQPAGPPGDGRERFDADIEDARQIIDTLGVGPAHVLASSSGAIIGLHLLTRHPDRIRTLVAHEPPLIELLPDAAEQRAFFQSVYDTYREVDVPAAMQKFLTGVGIPLGPRPSGELTPEMRVAFDRMQRNQAFWIEQELRTYPLFTPDFAALERWSSHLVLGVGRDSAGTLPHRPNLVLAERLRLPLCEFSGGHIGFATHASDFAARLHDVLAAPHPGRLFTR